MDKRRLIIGLIVVVAIPLYIWIAYFEIPNKAQVGEDKLQQDPLKHDFESVLEFNSEYIGDASNSNALFQSLPLNEYKDIIKIDSERYSIRVNYNVKAIELGGMAEQAVIYNATAAFLIIANLQEVELTFLDESYRVNRKNVDQWFDIDFMELKDPQKFKEKVQKSLGKSDIDSWLEAYTEGERP